MPGVVDWIEHPLLMLKIRGSNPGHSIEKKTPLFYLKPSGSTELEGAYPVFGVTLGPDQKTLLTDVIFESENDCFRNGISNLYKLKKHSILHLAISGVQIISATGRL